MTVAEAITYCRRMHNAEGDDNWADEEICKLLEAKANECVQISGLIEDVVTTSTVADTDEYAFSLFDEDMQFLKRLEYNGEPLKRISHKYYELRVPLGVNPSGKPNEYFVWNNTIYLTPNPSEVGTLTAFIEKKQSAIADATGTLDVPEIFHPMICDGVIWMMYMKDLNQSFAVMFRDMWMAHKIEMMKFAKKRRRSDGYNTVIDADTALETDFGVR